MIPSVITALTEFLKADADVASLAGTRVFGAELPEGEAINMPRASVVCRPSGGGSYIPGRSYIEIADPRVDITCYGATPYQADRTHRAVHAALKQMRRNVSAGCLLHWALPTVSPLQLRDPDAEWPMVLSVWQVLYSEKEVS